MSQLDNNTSTSRNSCLYCLIHSEEGLKEAENMISKVLEELSDPASVGTTCTPAVLEQRIDMCMEAIDNSVSNFSIYSEDSTGM